MQIGCIHINSMYKSSIHRGTIEVPVTTESGLPDNPREVLLSSDIRHVKNVPIESTPISLKSGFFIFPDPLDIPQHIDYELIDTLPSQETFDKITDTRNFHDGLTQENHRVKELQEKVSKSYITGYDYIAKHTNPHKLAGMLQNVGNYISSRSLNKNCIICSKAVEKNLATIESGKIKEFWVAQSTKEGYLSQNVSESNYHTFVVNALSPLSQQLIATCQKGSRYIINVPVKGKTFNHSMNLIMADFGIIIIDGQNGKTHNLSSPRRRQDFDKSYGLGLGINIVEIYLTGKAPSPSQEILLDGWEIV